MCSSDLTGHAVLYTAQENKFRKYIYPFIMMWWENEYCFNGLDCHLHSQRSFQLSLLVYIQQATIIATSGCYLWLILSSQDIMAYFDTAVVLQWFIQMITWMYKTEQRDITLSTNIESYSIFLSHKAKQVTLHMNVQCSFIHSFNSLNTQFTSCVSCIKKLRMMERIFTRSDERRVGKEC